MVEQFGLVTISPGQPHQGSNDVIGLRVIDLGPRQSHDIQAALNIRQ